MEVDKQQVDSPAEGNPVEDTLAEGNHAVVDKLPAAEEDKLPAAEDDKLPVDTRGRDDYDVRRILCLVRDACPYPFYNIIKILIKKFKSKLDSYN